MSSNEFRLARISSTCPFGWCVVSLLVRGTIKSFARTATGSSATRTERTYNNAEWTQLHFAPAFAILTSEPSPLRSRDMPSHGEADSVTERPARATGPLNPDSEGESTGKPSFDSQRSVHTAASHRPSSPEQRYPRWCRFQIASLPITPRKNRIGCLLGER